MELINGEKFIDNMGLTRDLGAVLVTLLIGQLVYILNGLTILMIQWNPQLLSKS